MCQPSPKNWVFGFFRLGLDLGPVGTGDWGLGLGLDNKFPRIRVQYNFTKIAFQFCPIINPVKQFMKSKAINK